MLASLRTAAVFGVEAANLVVGGAAGCPIPKPGVRVARVDAAPPPLAAPPREAPTLVLVPATQAPTVVVGPLPAGITPAHLAALESFLPTPREISYVRRTKGLAVTPACELALEALAQLRAALPVTAAAPQAGARG